MVKTQRLRDQGSINPFDTSAVKPPPSKAWAKSRKNGGKIVRARGEVRMPAVEGLLELIRKMHP